PYHDYLARKNFYGRYDEHVLRGARLLDSLYRTFKPQTPGLVKDSLKWQTIERIVTSADTLTDERTRKQARLVKKRPVSKLSGPNNAYFIGYLTYRKQQNRFQQEFDNQFGSNFNRYLTYLKKTYPSL
ncbi:MAG: aminopeptidase, partial [Cytophagaceae bacterium]